MLPHLNERQQRLALATEARLLGHGGIRTVARAAGVSESTVRKGVSELEGGADALPAGRIRRSGAGRMRAETADPELVPALMALVEPDEHGDPTSPLRWTTKSLRCLAGELTRQGHRVTAPTVGRLLRENGFTSRGAAKTLEGQRHPDRDVQFHYINELVKQHLLAGEPVISVDTRKKEQLGRRPAEADQEGPRPPDGPDRRPLEQPVRVEGRGFVGPGVDAFGVAGPTVDKGWVSVGIDHETTAFAVASIGCWWRERGALEYPAANRLLIAADAGAANGYRHRLWKAELAARAAETGLTIMVCHFPAGTSKWNTIGYQLFSHLSMSWSGRSLTSHEVVVNTIMTTTGTAASDSGVGATRIADGHDRRQNLSTPASDVHGRWNYHIAPTDAPGAGPGTRPGTADRADRAADRAEARAQTLELLADPRLTGMSGEELDALRARLAAAQAARTAHAERRRDLSRGGAGVPTTSSRGRPLLSPSDQVLVTVLYLRQVCSQKVLCDVLEINPVTIGKVIKATRQLLAEQKISIIPAVARHFTRADDLLTWARDTASGRRPPAGDPTREALTDPVLTGMSRAALHTLLEELMVPYAAVVEERRDSRRGDRRRPGTRGGVFRQKITDGDRILAAILYQRGVCGIDVLAELLNVSRSTLRGAINDVLPILRAHPRRIGVAERRHRTAAGLLAAVAEHE
ncbi:ISAzo13 family transposase [Solwaraspora sp. WMMD406]|uniref:ISAzo13 family transposase n=1 Tax=Solwaraspora sp. WMMD406 TaxID=3016095 RepID=UPI002415C23B|nr:ISAzo13 family transposase [Solwaraspora sp. WMMD406]MDG4762666.1 ISAzo13 family transposase [Solwaraspora sp. WMMD406]